jgi:3-dehydroquinate dehydratase-1
MKIVVSLTDPDLVSKACSAGADCIEIRLDLMHDRQEEQFLQFRRATDLPLIATLRSRREGGRFDGTRDEWYRVISPILTHVDMVDIETAFRDCSPFIRKEGKEIISSLHTDSMLSPEELETTEKDLRNFGDIPKIVVRPGSEDDVISFLQFTHRAGKPICTSIMGDKFRYARALLPLFGSELVFCHAGTPTAAGQYHVDEMRTLQSLLME